MPKDINPKPNPAQSAGNPLGSLMALDRQMEGAGYDADHPWRHEISAALDEVDNINRTVEVLDDLLRLALQKCVDTGIGSEAQSAIRAARRYAGDITDHTDQMTGVAA